MTLRTLIACLLIALVSVDARAQEPAAQPPRPRTARDAYKNILVLDTLPAEDLMRTMHLMRASLGVRCDFCHDVDHYEADTKAAKITARRMIGMVLDLNARAFEGRPVVTCNTCHRGAIRPVAVPLLTQGRFADTTRTETTARMPTGAAAILDRYLEAAGGRAAVSAATERTLEGAFVSPAIVGAAGAPAALVNRGKSEPVVIRVTGGDELHLTTGAGAIRIDIEDGRGVVRTPSATRDMTAPEVQSLLQRLDPRQPLKLRDQAASMTALEPDQIGGRPMAVLTRTLAGGRSQLLYFDAETGLLRRAIVLSPTPVGLDPEQVDFEDYRRVDGLVVPFTITTSYLDDNHYGTTLRFTRIHDDR